MTGSAAKLVVPEMDGAAGRRARVATTDSAAKPGERSSASGGPAMPRRDFLFAAGGCSGAVLLAAGQGALLGQDAAPPPRSGPPARVRADAHGSTSAATRRPSAAPTLERIGVQLYTVRSLAAEDMAATLDAVAAVGYADVEFAGWFGHPARTLRGWLDDAGLEAPAAHVGADDLTGAGLDATLETASALGVRWLVLPWLPPERRTPDGYRAAADALNAAGAAAQSAGVRVAYHNHAFEFEPLDAPGNPTGYDILLKRLDPAVTDMEIDFHWSTAGGVDAAELFATHAGRFVLWHVKDRDAEGRMTDVGAGDIDWNSLFALSAEAGLRHYFVEHDHPADPLESIRASFRYLKGRQPPRVDTPVPHGQKRNAAQPESRT